MHGVARHYVENLRIFFARGPERAPSGRDVVEKILHLFKESVESLYHVNHLHTVICVPPLPAMGFGSVLCPGLGLQSFPSE